MSCGCNNSSDSNPSGTHRVIPDLIPVVNPSGECSSSICDDRYEGLQRSNGIRLLGVFRRCLRNLCSSVKGLVVTDENGMSVVTNQIDVVLPENIAYQRDGDGNLVLDTCTQQPARAAPPRFPFLLGVVGGIWRRISGQPTARKIVVWDGDSFTFEDVPAFGTNQKLSDFVVAPSACGFQFLGVQMFESQEYDDCNNAITVQRVHLARATFDPTPVGSIMAYGGGFTAIPTGWLACDGSVYSSDSYPDLFDVVGHNWGGTGTSFNVPDLRGEFLRGADNGAGHDPDTFRGPGSYQGASFQQHTHSATTQQTDSPAVNFAMPMVTVGPTGEGETGLVAYGPAGTSGTDTINSTITGIGVSVNVGPVTPNSNLNIIPSETRPRNAAVNYLIYAGCRMV